MINPSQASQTKPEELLLEELDEVEDEPELEELLEPELVSPPQADKLRASKSALKCGKLARKSQEVLIIGSLTG